MTSSRSITVLLTSMMVFALLAPSLASAATYAITVSAPNVVKQGDMVTVSGMLTQSGAAVPNSFVNIVVKNPSGSDVGVGSYRSIVLTGADGSYSDSYRLPAGAPLGTYSVSVTASPGGIQTTASTSFTVGAVAGFNIVSNPTYGAPLYAPGANVLYTGSGFTAGQNYSVSLWIGSMAIRLAQGTVGSGKTISGSFTVPPVGAGIYSVQATDGTGISSTQMLVIAVPATAAPADVQAAQTAITSAVSKSESDVRTDVATAISNIAGVGQAVSGVQSSVNNVSAAVASSSTTITSAIAAAQSDMKTSLGNSITASQTAITGALTSTQQTLSTSLTSIGQNVNGIKTSVDSVNTGVSQVATFSLVVLVLAIIIIVIEVVLLVRRR